MSSVLSDLVVDGRARWSSMRSRPDAHAGCDRVPDGWSAERSGPALPEVRLRLDGANAVTRVLDQQALDDPTHGGSGQRRLRVRVENSLRRLDRGRTLEGTPAGRCLIQ